jgi:hypothetical protein
MPHGNSNIAIGFLLTLQIPVWITACVIWKDLRWWADPYRRLKYRGGCTIPPLFQISVWCENCVAAWHYADIGIQLLFANNTNRAEQLYMYVGLSQNWACTSALICLKISAWIAYRGPIEWYHFQTTSFLIGQYQWYVETICRIVHS